MTTFDKREEGFEKKFAHDEELRFKANARRNKLLGLWAAEKMGSAGPAADAYAKEVVMADFEEAGDDDVFRKVRKDFDAKGVAQSDQQIRKPWIELMAQAIDQIKARHLSCAGTPAGRRRIPHGFKLMANLPASRPPLSPPAKPSTPAGARLPRRSSPRRSRAKVFPPSISTSSTVCGTPPRPLSPSPRSAPPARRRSCACRSAPSPPRAARSISAPRASSRR